MILSSDREKQAKPEDDFYHQLAQKQAISGASIGQQVSAISVPAVGRFAEVWFENFLSILCLLELIGKKRVF